MQHSLAGFSIIATLALSSCVFAPDGGNSPEGGRVVPTLGQELLDLDRAHDAGVITTAQYERAKDRLLSDR
jgi:hypothetical protein